MVGSASAMKENKGGHERESFFGFGSDGLPWPSDPKPKRIFLWFWIRWSRKTSPRKCHLEVMLMLRELKAIMHPHFPQDKIKTSQSWSSPLWSLHQVPEFIYLIGSVIKRPLKIFFLLRSTYFPPINLRIWLKGFKQVTIKI